MFSDVTHIKDTSCTFYRATFFTQVSFDHFDSLVHLVHKTTIMSQLYCHSISIHDSSFYFQLYLGISLLCPWKEWERLHLLSNWRVCLLNIFYVKSMAPNCNSDIINFLLIIKFWHLSYGFIKFRGFFLALSFKIYFLCNIIHVFVILTFISDDLQTL